MGFSERPKAKNALTGTVSIPGLGEAKDFFQENELILAGNKTLGDSRVDRHQYQKAF